MTATVPFRFDADTHTYVELGTGLVLPHITDLLKRTGWVDDAWFTEESSVRGTAVHRLTADYDLEALHVETCVSQHRGYLLGYVKARAVLQLEILAVEEALVHPVHLFGGRPDRLISDAGTVGVLEIKTGVPARSHPIQTALQTILAEGATRVPPEWQRRLCLYLKPDGRFKVEEHRDPADYSRAREIIRACCGGR